MKENNMSYQVTTHSASGVTSPPFNTEAETKQKVLLIHVSKMNLYCMSCLGKVIFVNQRTYKLKGI